MQYRRNQRVPKAKGRRPANPEGMNKLERSYSELLEAKRLKGEILAWYYEAFNLKLAPKTHYRPDFLVMMADSSLEIHETKGFWRDDARVKIKAAAAMYPMFRFIAIQRKGGYWQVEEFG